ncbi:MAG: hypothetical protein HYT76_05655 [Deltaproteobacteria bacterium]|nr:hypothetical protein [Deltaproteobacteria bacterium]
MIRFRYLFQFKDGSKKEFVVSLDEETLDLINPQREKPPEWTRLGFHQCPNCPLSEVRSPYCPVALNLSDLIQSFKDCLSFEEAEIRIETAERGYFKQASLQKGISSLMGIYMVTSGCPVLGSLKPMVRFHLPFASLEETQYRVLSMYLLSQFIQYRNKKEPDWDLKGLEKIYDEIEIVNKAFSERLTSVLEQDAVANAVAILNVFAQSISFALDKNAFKKIEKIFSLEQKSKKV